MLSHQVFEYTKSANDCTTAIKLLNFSTTTPNELFARHLLLTSKQKYGQTLDDFLLSLQKLARDCNFRSVSGEQYEQDMVRDAFVSGLLSREIRRKLLKNCELDLESVAEKTRAAELVKKSSQFLSDAQQSQFALTSAVSPKTSDHEDAEEDLITCLKSDNWPETASRTKNIWQATDLNTKEKLTNITEGEIAAFEPSNTNNEHHSNTDDEKEIEQVTSDSYETSEKKSSASTPPQNENNLCDSKTKEEESCRVYKIQLENGIPSWEPYPDVFSCSVLNPKRPGKLSSGLKNSFTYNVTTSLENYNIAKRQCVQFERLFDELLKEFGSVLAISPPPGKYGNNAGNANDFDIIEERRLLLEAWLCRLSRHPVIAKSVILRNFVTPTDEKLGSKAKKRTSASSERNENFLDFVQVPKPSINFFQADVTASSHIRFVRELEECCKQLVIAGSEHVSTNKTVQSVITSKLGHAFKSLSDCFASKSNHHDEENLRAAIKLTGENFLIIADMYKHQPLNDWSPLLAAMRDYANTSPAYATMLEKQKNLLQKLNEMRKQHLQNKATLEAITETAFKAEKLTYITQAEMQHFQRNCVRDFVAYLRTFLCQQCFFQHEVTRLLEVALTAYKECTIQQRNS